MDITNISKEKHEEILLQYIETPYFRNNPTYIEWWRIYYQKYKDPQILLLMYHKQISTYYHWLHIELSEHFLRKKKPQIAHFILAEALKNNVYDPVKINEAMERIPSFEKKYTRGDMASILNWKNINALGRIWNVSKEESFYQKEQYDGIISFEIEKIKNYEEKFCMYKNNCKEYRFNLNDWKYTKTDGIFEESYDLLNTDLVLSHDDVMPVDIQNIKQDALENNGIEGEINSSFIDEDILSEECEVNINPIQSFTDDNPLKNIPETLNNTDISDQFAKRVKLDSIRNMFTIEPYSISGILEKGQDVCIDNYIYLVQESHEERIILLKMAKNSDITQTIVGKTICLKKSTQEACGIFKKLYGYDSCLYNDVYYLMYEYDCLCNIKDFIDQSSNIIKKIYLRKIIEKLLPLTELGYIISDPIGFFLDQEFNLGFDCVSVIENNHDTENLLRNAFSELAVPINIDLNTIKYLEDNTNTPEAKREVLKHKTSILQNI